MVWHVVAEGPKHPGRIRDAEVVDEGAPEAHDVAFDGASRAGQFDDAGMCCSLQQGYRRLVEATELLMGTLPEHKEDADPALLMQLDQMLNELSAIKSCLRSGVTAGMVTLPEARQHIG